MDFVTNFEMPIQYKKRGFIQPSDKQQVDELISKSTEMVLCLIEGNDDKAMIKKIIKSVNFPFMRNKLKMLYEEFIINELDCDPYTDTWYTIKNKLRNLTYFGEFETAFRINELVVMLQEYQDEHQNEDPEYKIFVKNNLVCDDQELVIAENFYKRFTKHIEINFNDKLVRVYFSLDPYTFYLTPNT